jgi:hypothetical protein
MPTRPAAGCEPRSGLTGVCSQYEPEQSEEPDEFGGPVRVEVSAEQLDVERPSVRRVDGARAGRDQLAPAVVGGVRVQS